MEPVPLEMRRECKTVEVKGVFGALKKECKRSHTCRSNFLDIRAYIKHIVKNNITCSYFSSPSHDC